MSIELSRETRQVAGSGLQSKVFDFCENFRLKTCYEPEFSYWTDNKKR